ncbi:MAG: class GN sortase [Pseudomonadota bacterium]
MKTFNRYDLLPCVMLIAALLFWGQGLWIYAKAQFAQVLIADAWQRSLVQPDRIHKPWQWADTWPVLRLQWQRLDAASEDLYVLSGADGSALAFGPGLLSAESASSEGLKVIAAHRDTHFEFLQDVNTGDTLSLQDISGAWHDYRVDDITIVDSRDSPLIVNSSVDGLLLITCYPFHAVNPGGPLRYLVTAYPVPGAGISLAAH